MTISDEDRKRIVEAMAEALYSDADGHNYTVASMLLDAALSAGLADAIREQALREAAAIVRDMPIQIYRDEGIGPMGRSCKPATFEDAAAAIEALIGNPATPSPHYSIGEAYDAADGVPPSPPPPEQEPSP